MAYRRFDYASATAVIGATLAFLSACLVSVPASAEMNFELISDARGCGARCLKVISAQGEITEHSADAFLTFLDRTIGKHHLSGIVLLHSPGGNVVGAMNLGRVLRELGAAVVVARAGGEARVIGSKIGLSLSPGHCMSACVFVLMGGAKRIVPNPSEVGIHRMFRIEASRDPAGGANYKRVYASDTIVEALRQYSGLMGVSPSLVDSAERVSPDTVHIVNAVEMRRWRLGTSRLQGVAR
jgi:hypothetical protein